MGSFFRKPLGLFVAVLAVGFVLIAVGMKAFGGTSGGTSASAYHSPTPLSPAQFRRAGVRICLSFRALNKEIVSSGKARNLREATRDFRRFTPKFDRLTAELDGLVPPPSAGPAFRRARNNLDAFDGAMDQLDHFAETQQWRRFVLFVRSPSYKNIVRRLGPAKKLGDINCGQAASRTSA